MSQAAVATERYRVIDPIGEGGTGVVYRVEDRQTGTTLAMKVIPRTAGKTNLRAEFLALARLEHPNIVRVHDYGLTDAGHDFFTMDRVAGPPLLEAVAGPFDASFYPVIGGVLRALAFVHARGMVHADIKPSNILIDAAALGSEPLAAARVVDFGLAAELSNPAASAARGTFRYAAPEVYAGRVNARSDLYALGVVLYELVTRAKPYPGDDVGSVLRAQRAGAPADPRELCPQVSDGLAELILGLLDPAPAARPQTADEVLARLNTIGGADLPVAAGRPLIDLGSELVGRERELDELLERWHATARGEGSAVLITGEAGVGSSRLLAELKLRVQLAGGCAVRVSLAARPDAPFTGVGEALRGLAIASGHDDNDLLAPLRGEAETERLEPESRFALAEAVVERVIAASDEAPLLLALDNVDRADDATLELLVYLARAAAEAPVMLAMTTSDSGECVADGGGDAAPSAGLATLSRAIGELERGMTTPLARLDGEGMRRLIASALGDEIASELAAELHRKTGGNPGHAAHAINALIDSGALSRSRGAWKLALPPGGVPMPASAVASALARVDALTANGAEILRIAAALGTRFRRDQLIDLVADERGTTPDSVRAEVNAALADAVTAGLIGADVATGWFFIRANEVAQALRGAIEPAQSRRLHERSANMLAAAVEAGEHIPAEALAAHYLALDAHSDAARWCRRAAEQREASRDPHGARRWYERARPLVADSSAEAIAIDERLGELCAMLGDTEAAVQAFSRAANAAEAPDRRIDLQRRLAEILRRRGESDEALDTLMIALGDARRHRLFRHEAASHLSLGYVRWYRADYAGADEHATAGLLIARSNADRALAAQLGKLRADVAISRGDPAGALPILDEALDDAEAEGDETAIADVRYVLGRAAIHAGDYARAIAAYEHAIPTFERLGRIQQLAKSYNNLGAACYLCGEWGRARESLERFRDLCLRLGEDLELLHALNNLGNLYRELGELSQALVTLDRGAAAAARVDHPHVAANLLGNRGETLFRQGALAEAGECYRQSLAQFEAINAGEDVVETRRRLCELDIALGHDDQALSSAIDTIRAAQDAGLKLEEGILHRVAATALRLQGDTDSASWFCDKARQLLEAIGSRLETANASFEAAELSVSKGEIATAQQLLREASEAYESLGARWHLNRARARLRSLRPRRSSSAALSAVGRDVVLEVALAASQLATDDLLDLVLDRALQATAFDRGFVLLLDGEGRPRERRRQTRKTLTFGHEDAEFSGSLVRRVAASGEALAVTNIADDTGLRDQASVIALGLQQVMCAPMHARGRVIGIVYVDSRRMPREDQAADLALLETLAAQAATAVELARLEAESRRKTELMGVLAHEIRNPLAGILGFSSPVETSDLTDVAAGRELFDFIHRDAQRLRRLVDNVLELVRHAGGNAEFSIGPFDLAAVLEQARASQLAAVRDRGLTIEIDAAEDANAALGNPDRIAQVVTNLLGNAVKFAPDGSAITLRVCRELIRGDEPAAPPVPVTDVRAWAPLAAGGEPRAYLRVDVIDRGPGMSEEIRDRLFDKFAQGAKRSKGVGLGLYISRAIIEQHAGSIWVESEPGKGATFSFRIPTTNHR